MKSEYKKYSLQELSTRMDNAIERLEHVIINCDSICNSEQNHNSEYQTAYVYTSVVSIVINSYANWGDEEGRKELALGYKILFQETINILRDSKICKSFFFDGMHIIAIFDTPQKKDVEELVDLSAKISSLVDIWRFKRNRSQSCIFKCSIGIHYGPLLKFDQESMNHSGNSNIYLGQTMTKSNQISFQPIPDNIDSCIRLTPIIFQNLSEEYQKLFHWEIKYDCYQSCLYNVEMKNWLIKQEENR